MSSGRAPDNTNPSQNKKTKRRTHAQPPAPPRPPLLPPPPPNQTTTPSHPRTNKTHRIAGHETTAATLGFTLAHLSANPDCERKVLEELDRVLGVDVPAAPAGAPAATTGGGAAANAAAGSSAPPRRAIREPAAADIGRLPYLEACFREALRLHPAVTAVTRDAARETVLLGEHRLARGQRVQVNLVALHRHPDHWSGDGLKPVDAFDPERFMPPHAARRHPAAFGGFGFGSRACIGSQFALLEAKTFLAVLLPRFAIRAAGAATASDPAPPFPYPPPASLADGGAAPTAHGLRLRVHPRPGFVAAPPPPEAAAGGAGTSAAATDGGENLRASGTSISSPSAPPAPRGGGAKPPPSASASPASSASAPAPVPFHVLFGSNSGTCEALASRVAEVAAASGFSPVRLTSLDAAHAAIKADGGSGSLPARAAVAVVCSTYNGTPPDNARAFLGWAQAGSAAAAAAGGGGNKAAASPPPPDGGGRVPAGVGYCVVGLGNSQWAATYQKVPRALDESLEGFGATRVRAFRGIDVNEPDFVDAFEGWLATLGTEFRVHFGMDDGAGAVAGAAAGVGGAAGGGGGGGAGEGGAAASGEDAAPSLASLAPAPRFTLEALPGCTISSPGLAEALAARGLLAPDEDVCLDIAAVSRALVRGRRRLAGAGTPSAPVSGGEPYHILRVLRNEELQHPSSDRSTRHVELELPSPSDADRCGSVPAAGDDPRAAADPSRYEAGDHLELLACNAPALVDAALRALGLAGDEVVVWSPVTGRSARGVGAVDASSAAAGGANGAAAAAPGAAAAKASRPIAVATTSKMLLAWVADLGAPPSRRLVEALVGACACPPERRAARDKFCSPAGYKQNVLLARLTVPELLSSPEMRSAPAPPLGALLLALPRVAPRYYSISSSPLASEGKPFRTCSVTVGLVRFATGTGRVHEGACSSLAHRTPASSPGGFMIGTVRRLQSTFRLPGDPTAPIVMIGPGTGVAPMMGFLQERAALQSAKGKKLGPAHLFFGCRSDADFIYKETLEGYAASGVLTGLHVAYSRKDGVPKTYVQTLIEQEGAELWRLLSSRADGRVYVCGDARRMAPDVRAAFRELAVRHGGRSQAAADSWIGSMVEGARYLEDVWAGTA